MFDRGEIRLYFSFVVALLTPGHRPGIPDAYGTIDPGDLDGWSPDDVNMLIDEGRRTLDAADGYLTDLRSRGQTLFTVLLAFVAFAVGSRVLGSMNGSVPFFVAWYAGLAATGVGLVGAASVMATTAVMGSVDPVLLSREKPDDLHRTLAVAYAAAVKQSRSANMARFTVLRDATWFAVIGVVSVLGAWIGFKLTV